MITQFQSSGKDKTPALCKVFSISRKALPKTHHGFYVIINPQKQKSQKQGSQNFIQILHIWWQHQYRHPQYYLRRKYSFPHAHFGSLDDLSVRNQTTQVGGNLPEQKKKVQTFTCHVAAIPLRFNCRTANQGPFAEQWELIRKPLRIGDCFVYWTSSYPDDFCFWNQNITKGICTKLETSSTSRNGNAQWIFDDRRCVQKSVFAAAFAFKEKPR